MDCYELAVKLGFKLPPEYLRGVPFLEEERVKFFAEVTCGGIRHLMDSSRIYLERRIHEQDEGTLFESVPWAEVQKHNGYIRYFAQQAREENYPTIEETTKYFELFFLGAAIAFIKEKQKNPTIDYKQCLISIYGAFNGELHASCFSYNNKDDDCECLIKLTHFTIAQHLYRAERNENLARLTSNYVTTPDMMAVIIGLEETLHFIQYSRDPKTFGETAKAYKHCGSRREYLKNPIEIEAGNLVDDVTEDFGQARVSAKLMLENLISNSLAR